MQGSSFPEFEIGAVLDGRFEVLRLIGRGAMGIVLEARHLGLRQRVALKVLRPDAAASPGVAARFVREAHAAARLKSEHVVRIMDVGKLASGLPYIVMEHLQGADLARRLLEKRRLGFDEVTDYLFQTLEALAEAHRAGVIHRDLKPANLFVARLPGHTHCIKVLDFGISKLSTLGVTTETEITAASTLLGSPLYMSPEQLEDARAVEPASDIWSLGVIAYELLSGTLPFQADTLAELLDVMRKGERARLTDLCPGVPPEYAHVIERCLEADPQRRFASAKALTVALAPWANTPERMVSVERILHVRSSRPASGRDSRPSAGSAEKRLLSERRRERPHDTVSRSRAPLLAAGVLLVGVCALAWLATRSAPEAKAPDGVPASARAPATPPAASEVATPLSAPNPVSTSVLPASSVVDASLVATPRASAPMPRTTTAPRLSSPPRRGRIVTGRTAKAPPSAPTSKPAATEAPMDALQPMPVRPLDEGNPFRRK